MTIAQYIQENKYTELRDISYGLCILLAGKALAKIGVTKDDADGSTKILENGNTFSQSIVMGDKYAVTVEVEMKGMQIVKKYISPVRNYID